MSFGPWPGPGGGGGFAGMVEARLRGGIISVAELTIFFAEKLTVIIVSMIGRPRRVFQMF